MMYFRYRLFGDAIYPLLNYLIRPFINPAPGSPEAYFNLVLATVRVSVEHSFGLVTNTFQAVDFTRWQRVFLTRPGLQYRVACLLTNCISCVRQTNMVAHYFQCPLPTIQQYLSGSF